MVTLVFLLGGAAWLSDAMCHVHSSGVIFGQNRSVGDTSMKIVMSSVHVSLDKKTLLAN